MSGRNNKVECQICNKTLHSKYIYEHIEKVHKVKAIRKIDLKCPSCDYEGPSSRELKAHVIQKHDGKRHACNMCPSSFKNKVHLKDHVIFTHMGVKDVKCTYCNYTARSDYKMKKHVAALHTDIRTHSCPACNFKSAYADSLKKHIAVIHGIEKIACSVCDHVSNSKQALIFHNKAVHTEKEAKAVYQCPECDYKTYTSPSVLKIHVNRVHRGEKPFKCGQCDYAAGKKQSLQHHVEAVHEKIKDKQCPHCEHNAASY